MIKSSGADNIHPITIQPSREPPTEKCRSIPAEVEINTAEKSFPKSIFYLNLD
jgi:hypothetical protein